jgi:hypothetical protein
VATKAELATRHCVLSSSLRITRSVGSSGGNRTRIATSNPSAIRSMRPVGAFEMNLDSRVLDHEAGNQPAELGRHERHRTTDPDHAGRLGAHRGDGVLRRFGLDQHGHAAIVEFAAALGYREAAR